MELHVRWPKRTTPAKAERWFASEERCKKCRGLSPIAGICQHLAWTTKTKRRTQLHPLTESVGGRGITLKGKWMIRKNTAGNTR